MSKVVRADQVGSLLRPEKLLRARGAFTQGSISEDQLHQEEDSAILRALDRQRQLGLGVLTDSEFRRANWAADMADAVEGFVSSSSTMDWHGPGGGPEAATAHWLVAARLTPRRRLTGVESQFLRRHAPGNYKEHCLLHPTSTSPAGGRE